MAFAAKKDNKKKKRDSRGAPLSADSFLSPGGLGTTQQLNCSPMLPSSSTTRFVTQWSVSAAIRGPGEQVLELPSKHRLTWGQASRQRSPTSGQGETSPKPFMVPYGFNALCVLMLGTGDGGTIACW
jgi:hypothetical protein